MKATVFGASGFIGSHLVRHLQARGFETRSVARGDPTWRREGLGHVFYCVGLTADFRARPFDAIEAHVCHAAEVLRHARMESFLYLSSTRVYGRASDTDETAPVAVAPADASDLYNLSKLMGEAACLGGGRANARAARLSNVFGADLGSSNFLTSVIRDAVEGGVVRLHTSLESEKDYIWIGDVVRALEAIAVAGTEPIYNVASGTNTSHREICALLEAATGCAVTVDADAPTVRFPGIDMERLQRLWPFEPTPLSAKMGELAAAFSRAPALA